MQIYLLRFLDFTEATTGKTFIHLLIRRKWRQLLWSVTTSNYGGALGVVLYRFLGGCNHGHYWRNWLLTPCRKVILEKPTSSQLVMQLSAFYGTRSFITPFTSARHLSLSWARSIQSIPPHPISWRSILISSHLRLSLPSGLFPSGFPTNKLYTPLLFTVRARGTRPWKELGIVGWNWWLETKQCAVR